MNRPPTDRDRALAAEARVAELEAELAEYRRAEASDGLDQAYIADLGRVRAWLRAANPHDRRSSRGFSPAALLLALLAASPRVVTRLSLVEAMRWTRVVAGGLDPLRNDAPDDKVVDVVLVGVRRALATVPASVLTWRSIGFSIATPDAAAIRAAIGLGQ
jgi:hypothetical protein